MENFTPFSSLMGGLLIGTSAAIVLATQGRMAGITMICGAALGRGHEGAAWRLAFIAGLLVVGAGLSPWFPASFATAGLPSLPGIAAAGLMVGFGTRLGNGCTSGHGVCGVSRLSPRSLAATLTFIATGAMTVYATHHLIEGGP